MIDMFMLYDATSGEEMAQGGEKQKTDCSVARVSNT